MKKYKVEEIASGLELGEGCIWDAKRRALHYVDISRFYVYTYYVETEKLEKIYVGDYVGCIVLNQENDIVAAVKNQLVRIQLDTETMEVLCTIDMPEHLRFNDGKCDKFGNLWVGTMAIEYGVEETKGIGSLYCIKGLHVVAEYQGYSIPNGLDWSMDGDEFYHIDTAWNGIDVYHVAEEYKLENRKRVVTVAHPQIGSPDGMCMDAQGNFWVAMWGGSSVNCYSGKTGEILDTIELPSIFITCCTFGGEYLEDLYITTAEEQGENGKGKVFVVRNTGIKGKKGNCLKY